MNESNEWTRQGRRQEKKKKKGRIGFILILLLAIITVAGTYYASKINTTINSITQSVGNRTEEEANEIYEEYSVDNDKILEKINEIDDEMLSSAFYKDGNNYNYLEKGSKASVDEILSFIESQ